MKFIFCPHCEDIVRLKRETRYCQCRSSWGRYTDDANAIINNVAIPLGLANSTLVKALKERPKSGLGSRFTAFVIPEECPTIRVEDGGMIVVQKKIPGCDEPFFYDGTIAEKSVNGKTFYLTATGDIQIYKDGDLVYYKGYGIDKGFGFLVENDKDLEKVCEKNGFSWSMNNWFEVVDSNGWDFGLACHSYDEGIKILREAGS